jgi:predicted RNase H-like HicB family nuclease
MCGVQNGSAATAAPCHHQRPARGRWCARRGRAVGRSRRREDAPAGFLRHSKHFPGAARGIGISDTPCVQSSATLGALNASGLLSTLPLRGMALGRKSWLVMTEPYNIIVYTHEDTGLLMALCVELPGFIAHANSRAELEEKIQGALDSFLRHTGCEPGQIKFIRPPAMPGYGPPAFIAKVTTQPTA